MIRNHIKKMTNDLSRTREQMTAQIMETIEAIFQRELDTADKAFLDLLELVIGLEQLAMEARLKTRIIDALRERKKELQLQLTDKQWEKELLLIDETVAYMEKQLLGREADIIVNDGSTISKAAVRARIQEIWSHCRETNRALKSAYRQTQAVSRQKLESDMMDWTNVAANYEMMSDPSRSNVKCHEVGQQTAAGPPESEGESRTD